MGSSPGTSRSKRAHFLRAALPCFALTAPRKRPRAAQSLTPDLFSPNRGGFASPDTLPTRRTAGVPQAPSDALPALPDPNADLRKRQRDAGAVAHRSGPDLRPACRHWRQRLRLRFAKPQRQQPQLLSRTAEAEALGRPRLAGADDGAAESTLGLPSIAPPPSESAHKTPASPAMAGTVPGQPLRRRLKIDDDAFGAVGYYAGSFLIKGGLELSTGHDTTRRV